LTSIFFNANVIKACQGHHIGCPHRPSCKLLLKRMHNLMHWHVGWGFSKELPCSDVRERLTRHQNGWSIPRTRKHLIYWKSWSVHHVHSWRVKPYCGDRTQRKKLQGSGKARKKTEPRWQHGSNSNQRSNQHHVGNT